MLFGGSRGGGKSDSLLGKVIQHAGDHGQHARMLILRKQFRQLEEIIERSDKLFVPLGAKYRLGDMQWNFPNGAWLKFRAIETWKDVEKHQGHSHTLIGVDEAGNFEESAPIDAMNATLRSPAGVPTQMILTANPGGAGHAWIKARYMTGQVPLRPFTDPANGLRRVFIPSKLTDNPALLANDPGYVSKLRASGSAELVKAWLEGDWDATMQGKLIQMDWFGRYDTPPARDNFDNIAQSADCAIKGNAWNSHNVITTWGRCRGRIYLLGVWREQVQYGDLKTALLDQARRWQPNVVLIEDKGNGSTAIQELRIDPKFPWPILGVEPTADKVIRMSGESPAIQAGMVLIPTADASAPGWLAPFESEVALFPESATKDQVDTMSQALWYYRTQVDGGWSFDFVGPTPTVTTDPNRLVLPSHFRFSR